MSIDITQSELSTYADCPWNWHIKYVRNLRPKRKSVKLILGAAIHEGVEAFFKQSGDPIQVVKDYCQMALDDADERGMTVDDEFETTLRKADCLIRNYVARYVGDLDKYNFLAVEAPFRIHLVDDIFIVGKIDRTAVEKRTGILSPFETKTAAQWNPDLNRLMLDFQVSVYSWAFSKMLGLHDIQFVYDIIKKPMLRQKKDESSDAFVERVSQDVTSRPDDYFIRDKVHRSWTEIQRTEGELIIRARELVKRRADSQVYRTPGDHCHWKCDSIKLCLEDTREMEDAMYMKVEAAHQELVPDGERQE